jgi:hypothetical protein
MPPLATSRGLSELAKGTGGIDGETLFSGPVIQVSRARPTLLTTATKDQLSALEIHPPNPGGTEFV